MNDASYNIKELEKIAWQLRINTIKSIYNAGSGHPGSSLSMAEIITSIFFNIINFKNNNNARDRFVLSKGHGVPMLYSAFAELGLINNEELLTLRKNNSRLQGHPDRVKLPFLDAGTGALGQGLSISIGYALAFKLLDHMNNKSICVVGDGEMQEGQIWEAIMYAGCKKLDNLYLIIDNNSFQNETSVIETIGDISFEDKAKSFNWNYAQVDGHNISEIIDTLNQFKNSGSPTIIDAKTIKGKGVDFMENNNFWHSQKLDSNNFDKAIAQCIKAKNDIN